MPNPRTSHPPKSAPHGPAEDVTDVAAPVDDAAAAEETARLRAENAELQDRLLRRAAEFQNYRRRTETELSGAREQGRAEAVSAVLDVYDDLRRSLEAAVQVSGLEEGAGEGAAADALRQGVELVHRKLGSALAALGVEAIAAVGQPFDEKLHEAVLQQPSQGPDAPSGTVIAEIQPGYRMGDRVLRHARVIVAS
jgi:molecular chaperone GrpE